MKCYIALLVHSSNQNIQKPFMYKLLTAKSHYFIIKNFTSHCKWQCATVNADFFYINQPTNPMEQGHPWKAGSPSVGQGIPGLLNPKVHYSAHKSPPLVPILIQLNPLHKLFIFRIVFNSILPLWLSPVIGLILSGFLAIFCMRNSYKI
jgi:hypothetical protein